MAHHVVVSVVVELLQHEEGFWCRRCLLPSGIRQWVAVRFGDQMHLQARAVCYDCGGHDLDLTG